MTADEFIGIVKFDERGLVPVVTQDVSDNAVLMVAWASAEALRSTFATGRATFSIVRWIRNSFFMYQSSVGGRETKRSDSPVGAQSRISTSYVFSRA